MQWQGPQKGSPEIGFGQFFLNDNFYDAPPNAGSPYTDRDPRTVGLNLKGMMVYMDLNPESYARPANPVPYGCGVVIPPPIVVGSAPADSYAIPTGIILSDLVLGAGPCYHQWITAQQYGWCDRLLYSTKYDGAMGDLSPTTGIYLSMIFTAMDRPGLLLLGDFNKYRGRVKPLVGSVLTLVAPSTQGATPYTVVMNGSAGTGSTWSAAKPRTDPTGYAESASSASWEGSIVDEPGTLVGYKMWGDPGKDIIERANCTYDGGGGPIGSGYLALIRQTRGFVNCIGGTRS